MKHNDLIAVASVLAFSSLLSAQTITLPDSICKAGTVPIKYSGSMNLNFTEGPAVNAAGDLFFTEPNSSRIWKIPASGTIPTTPFISNSSGANGLTIDVQDRLVAAQQNKVTRYNADGSVQEVLAQSAGALQLKNINDLTMGTKGQLYFTNWDGGQVFYRDPVSGAVTVALSGFVHANGIFLIEEDSTIFINEDSPGIIYKYKVAANGALSNRTEFARANVADGLRIDIHGNVYCAANADKAVCVFNKAGVLLGKIDLSAVTQYTTNCAFGGAGDKTLYITTTNAVYKVDLQIPGRRLSTMLTATLGGFAARATADGYRIEREAQIVRILLPTSSDAAERYGVFDLSGRLVRVLVPFSVQSGRLECAWEQGSVQKTKTACGMFVIRPLSAGAAPAAAVALFR